MVLGTGLSFHQVLATGASSLPVLLGTLAVALFGAWSLGRLLSVGRDLRTLIGVGTGIGGGASAIAATNAVISASEADVSYAIATIFTFNVVAVLTFPAIGHLIRLSPHAFGLWAGTAVNDMSSVVAASSIFSKATTSYAVVVKLTRTLMIIPISIALVRRARRSDTHQNSGDVARQYERFRHVLPVFITWLPCGGHRQHVWSDPAFVARRIVITRPGHDHYGIGSDRSFHPVPRHPTSGVSTAGARPRCFGYGGTHKFGTPISNRDTCVTELGPT